MNTLLVVVSGTEWVVKWWLDAHNSLNMIAIQGGKSHRLVFTQGLVDRDDLENSVRAIAADCLIALSQPQEGTGA